MMMSFKLLNIYILLCLLLSSFGLVQSEEQQTNLEDLCFTQILDIPIDFTQPQTVYQPIDISVEFENPCWAVNETVHSIRIAVETDSELTELESQIYNLHFKEDSILSSCNIVFLIPENINKNSQFLLRYGNSKTNGPQYPDHIRVWSFAFC